MTVNVLMKIEHDNLRAIVKAFGVFVVLVLVSRPFAMVFIPAHGGFLGLTLDEWFLLLLVPFIALCFAAPFGPHRWWLYYGLACSAGLFHVLHDYIFCLAGRRPWLFDPRWFVKGGALLAGLVVTPFVAAIIKAAVFRAVFGSKDMRKSESSYSRPNGRNG